MALEQIKVTATVRQIIDAGVWDDYCQLSGCNRWAVSEGKIDSGETVNVPLEIVGRLMEWSKREEKKGEFPKRTKMYLHGDKDGNRERGEELGLSEDACKKFAYALYEVEFDVEVEEDGGCRILAVDGKALAA